MAGINGDAAPIEDIEKAKKKIKELKNERDILLKENKILKKPVFLRKLLQKYGLCCTINLGLYKPK